MADTDDLDYVNGVDVKGLSRTIASVRRHQQLGEFQFRARNRWLDAGLNRSVITGFYGGGQENESDDRRFVFDCDEPPVLLGRDEGANPVEYLLHALAGCLTTTMVYHAAARGISIDAVESELLGDIDIRGFLGLSNEVARGYRNIRVTLHVKGDAPAERLADLAKYSPVFNTIERPTPVSIRVVKMQ